jgi:hypothetical protein
MSAYDEDGLITVWSDFTGILNDVAWGTGTLVAPLAEGIGFTSDDEGSFASTLDEPGGILAITTDVGDNDNAVLFAGPFFARDGGCEMKARFKYSNVDTSIFVGFCETLSLTAPAMPAEFATVTMTYNPGNMIGLQYDVDGTTDDFRAVMGDGSAALLDSGNGVRANATVTADRWFEAVVNVNPDGSGECWLSDSGHVDQDGLPVLRLIKRFYSKGATMLNTTDPLFATLMIENRSGNARVLEVDYFGARGYRDRRCT